MEAQTKQIIFWLSVTALAAAGTVLIYYKWIKKSGKFATQEDGGLNSNNTPTLKSSVKAKDDNTVVYKDDQAKQVYYTASQGDNIGSKISEITIDGKKYFKVITVGSLPTIAYVQSDKTILV